MAVRNRIAPLLFGSALAACAGGPPERLGVTSGRLAACPASPNCVSSQETGSHSGAPLSFPGDPEQAWSRLRAVLEQRRDVTVRDSGDAYLRVEFRTLLGFVDDGEFLLDPDARVIHFRSASRLGYSDLGKNRRRIEEIREAFAKAHPAQGS